MTAPHQPNPQPVRFQGAPGAAMDSALDTVLKSSGSGGQKVLGKALQIQEGDSGLSVVTFLQNNLVALLPKWLISRSPIETAEFSFLEVAESSLLYFALPFVGNKVFRPLFTHLAQKGEKTVEDKLSREVGVKAATILSTFGITLVGGEFMTHYVKNLITAKVFKKDRFSDVVNLSQGQVQADGHSEVVQKCQTRIKQCVAACAGIMGASFLLARGGGEKLPFLKKITEKSAEQIAKKLPFAKGSNGKLCLSANQMRLYMVLAVFAYMDSARDKLERVETATRLALILPYLAFGQGIFQNLALKLGPKYFAPILGADKKPLSLNELSAKALKGAPHDPKAAAAALRPLMQRKGVLLGAPLAFGIFGTGLGVGLLNRFWTKYRYQQQTGNPPVLRSPQAVVRPPVAPLNVSSPAQEVSTGNPSPLPFTPSASLNLYSQPVQPMAGLPTMPIHQQPAQAFASPYLPVYPPQSAGYATRI